MNGTQAVEFTLTIRKRLETGLSNFSSVLTHNHFTQDLELDYLPDFLLVFKYLFEYTKMF